MCFLHLGGGKHTECCLIIKEAKTKGWAARLQPGIIRLHTLFISARASGDTPLVYRTTRQACHKIHTRAFFYNGSKFWHKPTSLPRCTPPHSLYHGFSILTTRPFCSLSLPLRLPAFHLLLFPSCPLPPLSLQSISSQWSGRLTAAPPEEYQSMLLWRQHQTSLLLFLFRRSSVRLRLFTGWTRACVDSLTFLA